MKITGRKAFTLSLTFSILLLLFVIITGTYSFFSKKSTKSYTGRTAIYLKEINQINSKVEALIDNKTIKVDNTIELLPQASSSLYMLKEKVIGEIPDKGYKDLNDSIIKGLNANIALYDQLVISLENPNASDIGTSFQSLQQSKEICIESYRASEAHGLKNPIPQVFMDFLDNSFAYINTLIKLNRDNDITSAQKNDFIFSMDTLLIKFQRIIEDYELPLNSVRVEGRSYNGIINSIDENTEALLEITHSFNSLTVPNKALEVFNQFNLCINTYNKYIQSVRASVMEESISTNKNKLSKEALKLLYEESEGNYEELKLQMEKFIYLYEKYKKN